MSTWQILSADPLDVVGGRLTTTVARRCPSDEFVAALTRHSTPDKFIVLALVDAAFADMARNLYESSLRPNAIDNFLFVGVGRRACEILRNASLPCHHYTEDRATDVASTYRSEDFIRKMNIRTEMILDALSVGFTVLHTDLDVAFIRNPIPHLKVSLLSTLRFETSYPSNTEKIVCLVSFFVILFRPRGMPDPPAICSACVNFFFIFFK